ncbi:MAG: hypothetical protein IAF58_13000 [Leptolyngbya sp.]|nr:hypothetical protein [Candidatus Melainabacteria bacterium]
MKFAYRTLILLSISAITNNYVEVAAQQSSNPDGQQIAMVSPGAMDPAYLRQGAQQNYQSMNFTGAADLYRRICQTSVANATDFVWLAESLYRTRQYASAAQSFQEGINKGGTTDSVYIRLVESKLAARDMNGAKESCLKALASVKDDAVKKHLSLLLRICSMPLPGPASRDGKSAQFTER